MTCSHCKHAEKPAQQRTGWDTTAYRHCRLQPYGLPMLAWWGRADATCAFVPSRFEALA